MNAQFDRRTFLKLLGIGSGAGVLPACTDAPVQRLYAYLNPPAGVTPGMANWYASVCRECPAGCGTLIKTREGRPVKLEGHPNSPINRGALCLRGHSALQGLYDPDRFTQPRIGKPGRTRKATADQALAFVGTRLKTAVEGREFPGRVMLLTGVQTATARWFYRGLANLWNAGWVAYEPVQFAALKRASSTLFGLDQVPRFDLHEADFILNLGADLFESWQSPVEHARQLAERHGFAASNRIPFICMSPRRDLTAAMADRWISVRPGSFGLLALGLANHLLARSRLDEGTKNKLAAWLKPYSLKNVSPRVGCYVELLEKLGDRLGRASSPLVLPPCECLLGRDATREQEAVLILNFILGAIGRSVLYEQSTSFSHVDPARDLKELLSLGAQGEISVLIVINRDPMYEWPDQQAVKKALAKIPLLVQISEGPTETSPHAHAILPAAHALESWGDHQTRSDWISIQQPILRPSDLQKQAEDWLIALAGAVGSVLPWKDYRQCLAQHWTGLQQQIYSEESSTSFFKAALARGGQELPRAKKASVHLVETEYKLKERPAQASSHPWLLLYPSGRLYDGRCANRPWIQEYPDALTQTVWDTPVEISPELAKRLGMKSGDRAKVTGAGDTVEATVRVLPGMSEDVVALPLGGGKTNSGRIASGRGVRAWSLLKAETDPNGGGLSMLQTRISLVKTGPGSLLTTEGDPHTHNRPIVQVIPLKAALKGRGPISNMHARVNTNKEKHQPKHSASSLSAQSFNPTHDHPEHMWGMSVDLDLCTGCGACVLACQAENNVATVGPEHVKLGREMHWIRIERYWTDLDSPGGPVPRFIPIMCQHCENAPCEPVCPVFASYHTQDGLNAQVYNRCIGTRYCANNCPYKVRRFNWVRYRWPEPLNLQLNPDVTVRSTGVMEKCTFCIQRIRGKRNLARLEKREIIEGEIVPACVQTCPTGALQFGDRKLVESRVSKLARDFRAYRLFDEHLNTKPAVSYLCKVDRNQFPELG